MKLQQSFEPTQTFIQPETFESFLHYAAMGLELFGVMVILVAALFSTGHFLYRYFFKKHEESFSGYRATLGFGILLGLEFLVAADIVGTVAVETTWRNVGILALIVFIRTFLSLTLEMEIHGTLPWRRKQHGR